MDLGDGVFFVEETSLALAPGVPYDVLKQRLQQRLDQRGVQITEVIHEEFCLFPDEPAAAGSPSACVGLRWCGKHGASRLGLHGGIAVATRARLWLRHWPKLLRILPWVQRPWHNGAGRRSGRSSWCWRHQLYQFGLGRLMGFNEALLRTHFATFFALPREEWFGFLTNTLPLPRLMGVMLRLFAMSPWELRRGLVLGVPKSKKPGFKG